MKFYFYTLISFLFIGIATNAKAQDDYFKCGHDDYMQKLWAENPQMKEEYKQLFDNSRQVVSDGFKAKTVFTIPIVFHIIHEYGTENISDAQVYDQMEILNRDFSLSNSDISNVVAGFDTIAGNAEIQFKLAAIDPWGNCTNGIEHIYSHEAFNGDDYSKLNQWPRSRYLNVWVVAKMRDGAAGYAYYPTSTDGGLFFADGIIILHQYIGRIGTGTESRSRALTHEIGHYLGLPHVWGDTNEPGVACGDDGIEDTPVTMGFTYCPSNPNHAKICDTTIVENYQNYMDYSYCSFMFTKGQVNLMRNMLQSESGNRNMLINDSIHHLTGVDLPSAPLCAPVAEFSVENLVACAGTAIRFTDESWNAVVESREWIFEDANITTSTEVSPLVTFNSEGWKKVVLRVTNTAGTSEIVEEKAIYVYPSGAMVNEPKAENFEGTSAYWFMAVNPNPETPGFELVDGKGVDGSKCYVLNTFKDTKEATMYSDEYFYNFRKGGAKDYLYLPTLDLRYISGAEITFDYAYATEAFVEEDIKEVLELQSSDNCGKTWIPRKTINKIDLTTGGNSSGVNFVPTKEQWESVSVVIPAALKKDNVMFRFAFTASDLSNNLYIDNVNINGSLMTQEQEFVALNFNVYPNPSTTDAGVFVEFSANDKDVTIELTDLSGKVLSSETITDKNTAVNHKINTSSNLNAGVYLVRITQGTNQMVKKVVIL